MGLKSFLSRQREKHTQKKIDTLIACVNNPKIKSEDRRLAIDELQKAGTSEALLGLAQRFSFNYDKSIDDREEKEQVAAILIENKEKSLPPLRTFLKKTPSVQWPVKVLRELTTDTEIVSLLLAELDVAEHSFQREDAEKRADILSALKDFADDRIAQAVSPLFDGEFDDVTRIAAINLTRTQQGEMNREKLIQLYLNEATPIRIKSEILDCFLATGWTVKGFRKSMEEALPAGFDLTREGRIVARTAVKP
jgi:hypothetical protein